MSIYRYIKIIAPLRYLSMCSKKTAVTISASIWTIAIIIGLLPLLGWHKKYNDKHIVCRFFGVLTDEYFIFNFFLALTASALMLGMYIHILIVAQKLARDRHALTGGLTNTRDRPGHIDTQTWNLAKTVAIIMLVSNLCWLPGGRSWWLILFSASKYYC